MNANGIGRVRYSIVHSIAHSIAHFNAYVIMHITANKRIFVITDSTISHSRLRCTHARIVRMMNSLAGFWKTSGIKMNISLGVGLSLEISSTCAGIVVIW